MASNSESTLDDKEKTNIPKEKLVDSFCDVEDTLNELFDAVLGRKHKLHSVMEKLSNEVKESQMKVKELNKTIENQRIQLKQYTEENTVLRKEIKELKDPQNWKRNTVSSVSTTSSYGNPYSVSWSTGYPRY